MDKSFSFKLIVSDDATGNVLTEMKVPYDPLASLIGNLNDVDGFNNILEFAAFHPAPNVRESVAYKDKLSEKVFQTLSQDKSISVLRNLTRCEAFRKFATDELILKLIELDSECAQNIASSLEYLENADIDSIGKVLVSSKDPSVRYQLANNYSCPKRIVKMLLDDADLNVALEAKRRLES